MLRCNRCGQYYIPGFLDCRCRTMSHRLASNERLYASSSDNRTMVTLPFGAPQAKRITESVEGAPASIVAGGGSGPQRTSPTT